MLTPAKRLRLTEAVVEQLIAWIRSGGLSPRDKLPSERELMARAGVGRSSIREALQKTGGNRTRAAKLLGISRRTLLYRLKAYGGQP